LLLTWFLRRFFPPTEPIEAETPGGAGLETGADKEDDWEEVKEGESAENGAPELQTETSSVSHMETDTNDSPKIEWVILQLLFVWLSVLTLPAFQLYPRQS